MSSFELVGTITEIEVIATGSGIHRLELLRRSYGAGRWRKLKGVADIRLEAMAARKTEPHYAICIRNEDSEDLSLRRLYRVLPDERAAREGYLRVIDDSGEDYLYPASYFLPIELSQEIEESLAALAG